MSAELDLLLSKPFGTAQAKARLADTQGWLPGKNKTGSDIETGRIVIKDATEITVVTAAVTTDDTAMTIADSLSAEVGLFRLKLTNSVAAFLADSIVVVGKDVNDLTITDTIVTVNNASDNYLSSKLFSKITSVTPGTISDSSSELAVFATCVNSYAKPAATAGLLTGVGIVVATDTVSNAAPDFETDIPDEGSMFIATRGLVFALVDPVDQEPGTPLGTSGATAGNLAALPAQSGSADQRNQVVAILMEENSVENVATNKLLVKLVAK